KGYSKRLCYIKSPTGRLHFFRKGTLRMRCGAHVTPHAFAEAEQTQCVEKTPRPCRYCNLLRHCATYRYKPADSSSWNFGDQQKPIIGYYSTFKNCCIRR